VSAFQSILALLPQTQCTRCGYPDCAAYAHAIDDGEAAINQCPPGGEEGIARLANLLGMSAAPLNPENGFEGPRSVVWIDEAWCIGCTLCIEACPVDAIIGTHKLMHTVIEQDCTGCELCLPVCPVDCMQLENVSGEASGWQAWSADQADGARQRYEARQQRLQTVTAAPPAEVLPQHKLSRVEAALQRAKQLAEDTKRHGARPMLGE
jgi:electron transport complex protein RnfB